MMAYSLLIIAILTVASRATPLYCSDVQSPASGNGHNADLSQVTTLQYCIIDNCTIMRIDTGQQLDIVYTTESLLIVTPKDAHTSMVITKSDDELPCLQYPNTTDDGRIFPIVYTILSLLITMVSLYTLVVHLLFKELRSTLFGKLLMLYNLFEVFLHTSTIAVALMHYFIAVNSQAICYAAIVTITLTYTGSEAFSTIILYHLAYVMYRCYHLKSEISKKRSEYLFRRYAAYAAFTLILLFFVTIAYDWRTGNGKYTILANGHCNFDPSSYKTFFLVHFILTINKFLQIALFSAYLVYLYKFNLNVRAAEVTLQYSRLLFRIAIAMGATIGLSCLMYMVAGFAPKYAEIFFTVGITIFLGQQMVIMTTFICTKKMYALCKAYFSRD